MPRKRRAAPAPRRPRAKRASKPPVTYSEAGPVRTVAARLINARGEVPGLRNYTGGSGLTLDGLSALRQARIAFLFSTAEKVGRDALAQASKFAKKLWPLVKEEFDFLIVTSRPQWDRLTEEQRFALTYHELRHCDQNEKGSWVVVDHEFSGFYSEIKYFGFWNERARTMAQQMSLWDSKARVVSIAAAKS